MSKLISGNGILPMNAELTGICGIQVRRLATDIRFVVGGLILNRLISAINAARLVSSYNKRLEEEVSWNFSVGFMNAPNLPTQSCTPTAKIILDRIIFLVLV
ncbi:MAG: hypothetical protein MZV64_52480 [Ignavibacteriales bacterium]|nr:hypothetical protein [Ignavibacteriales bacterium]